MYNTKKSQEIKGKICNCFCNTVTLHQYLMKIFSRLKEKKNEKKITVIIHQ